MSITTVRAAIQVIGDGISGITKSFNPPPVKIDTNELPALYALVGDAVDDDTMLGIERILETRIYKIQVAVAPFAEANIEQIEEKVDEIYDAVKAAFHGSIDLGRITNVMSSRVIGDTGTGILAEYGSKFVGFEIQLEVKEYVPRTIVSG